MPDSAFAPLTLSGDCLFHLWLVRAAVVRPCLPPALEIVGCGKRWTIGGLFFARWDSGPGVLRPFGLCGLVWGAVRYGAQRGLFLRQVMTDDASVYRGMSGFSSLERAAGRVQHGRGFWRAFAGRRWHTRALALPLLPFGRRKAAVCLLSQIGGRIHRSEIHTTAAVRIGVVFSRSQIAGLFPQTHRPLVLRALSVPIGLFLHDAKITISPPMDIDLRGFR